MNKEEIVNACQDLCNTISPQELVETTTLMFEGYLASESANCCDQRLDMYHTWNVLHDFFVKVDLAIDPPKQV